MVSHKITVEELGTLAVSKKRRIFALAKGSSGETL